MFYKLNFIYYGHRKKHLAIYVHLSLIFGGPPKSEMSDLQIVNQIGLTSDFLGLEIQKFLG